LNIMFSGFFKQLRDFGDSLNTTAISFQKPRVHQASSLSKITSRMLVVLFSITPRVWRHLQHNRFPLFLPFTSYHSRSLHFRAVREPLNMHHIIILIYSQRSGFRFLTIHQSLFTSHLIVPTYIGILSIKKIAKHLTIDI